MNNDLYNTYEAADYIGMSSDYLRLMRSKRGEHIDPKIPYLRNDKRGKVLYRKADLDEYLLKIRRIA